MFFSLHPQGSDAGGFAVGLCVEVVAVDARVAKEAAHVRLSHVTPRAGHTQEVGDAAARVWVRGHAGGHRVAGNHAAWHWRRCTATPDP